MAASNTIRLVYKSTALVGKEGFGNLIESSRRNNARSDLTDILFNYKGHFFQVLEGEQSKLLALLDILRRDARHDNIEILYQRPIKSRQFELWGMGVINGNSKSLGYVTELLETKTPEKVEIAVSYLWRWLMESPDGSESNAQLATATSSLFKKSLGENLGGISQAQKSSKTYLLASIFSGFTLDALFFLIDHLRGDPHAWRMLVTYGFSASCFALSAFFLKNARRRLSGLMFQGGVIVSIAAHCLWMGYGIHAPSLAYLAIVALDESLAQSSLRKIRMMTIQSLALVAFVLCLMNIPGLEKMFDRPVPLHHSFLMFLLLPCVTFFVARSHLLTAEKLAFLSKEMLLEQTNLVKSLRKAMASRNVFFSSVSHEIRTPLAGIATAVALIKNPRTNPVAKDRYLDLVEKSTNALNLLLNDLLDISRLESEAFNLSKLEFDAWALTQEVVALFTPAAQENENSITAELVNAKSSVILGDALRLRQMLSNLISNANKFTKGGYIKVTLERLASDSGHTFWKCEVTDNGCGIASSSLKDIFNPFAQADNQRFTKTGGTGLGLAIVASLAKQMDGEVGVFSELGQGSRFWFSFRSL